MNVTAWELLLQVVVAVLVVGYGIWLRFIFTQQLNSKDATIKLLEAQIAALKEEVAPAIVRNYQIMKKHAEEMTEQTQRMATQLHAYEHQRHKIYLAGEANGLLLATDIMDKHIGDRIFEKPHTLLLIMQAPAAYVEAYREMNKQIGNRIQALGQEGHQT